MAEHKLLQTQQSLMHAIMTLFLTVPYAFPLWSAINNTLPSVQVSYVMSKKVAAPLSSS